MRRATLEAWVDEDLQCIVPTRNGCGRPCAGLGPLQYQGLTVTQRLLSEKGSAEGRLTAECSARAAHPTAFERRTVTCYSLAGQQLPDIECEHLMKPRKFRPPSKPSQPKAPEHLAVLPHRRCHCGVQQCAETCLSVDLEEDSSLSASLGHRVTSH